MEYFKIDIPFNNRHQCWFCGEPSDEPLKYPRRIDFESNGHIPLQIPSCKECKQLVAKVSSASIFDLKLKVTHELLKKYAKVLGIGINWTKLELENENLSGSAFIGFSDSAWSMYELAKQRISYKGWKLTYDGIPINMIDESYFFESEGIRFLNVNSAIDYYCDAEGLERELLRALTDIKGEAHFKDVLRISRTNVDLSRKEILEVIEEVEQQERDNVSVFKRNKLLAGNKAQEFTDSSISPVMIGDINIEPDEIYWLLSNGIKNFEQLCENEDLFFEDYHEVGGFRALELFNALQIYLGTIEDKSTQFEDPNRHLWSWGGLKKEQSNQDDVQSDTLMPVVHKMGSQFKAVGELRTRNSSTTAILIFDNLTDKKIIQKIVQLLSVEHLYLRQVSKESDDETEYLYLEDGISSSMKIIITDN
ncbi:hypothetical protein [Vibrio breoganii]|uniref:hypothetical protein n=1 Tax=Vibrio breoganii TaxID=553239 RepID=UPI0021C33C7B|nr:hypothetical protein [Vibrio breoganii]MDN3716543.1 hypothetical protein [Vibrio breoganii]